MQLEKNLNTADKIVRLVFSSAVIALFLFGIIGGPLAAGLVALSVVLLVTVIFSFCPIFRTFGVNHRNEPTPNERL